MWNSPLREAARVAAHGDEASFALALHDGLPFLQHVTQRDFDLHVLARFQAGQRLLGMQRGGCAEDDGIDLAHGQRIGELGSNVDNTILFCNGAGFVGFPSDERYHLDVGNLPDRLEVLDAEGTGTSKGHLDGHIGFSKMRCPTAVLLAGT